MQLHVTTDDFHLTGASSGNALQQPVIPERTTSLHRKTQTWPSERKRAATAGTIRFDHPPTLVRTPWELERGRPNSQWSRTAGDRTKSCPWRVFAQLPREIYQCIIEHVENVHRDADGGVDVAGRQHDLRSLCLVDKQWHRAAREHLYRELYLPGNQAPRKRFFSRKRKPSRLRLLKDALVKTPGLAFLVHRIHIGAELAGQLRAELYTRELKKDSALVLLQELVQQCHSLEHVTGCVLPAITRTMPLLDTLAEKTKLRSHAWSLSSRESTLLSVGDFIYCHDAWKNLRTLIISSDSEVDLGQVSISAVLLRLPALKHLMLSGLHPTDFGDRALMSLPPLRSLRLENLSGLTDQGIEQVAFSRLAITLSRLTLVGLGLVSLQTIQTLLSHLTKLKRFRFVQDTSPGSQASVRSSITPHPLYSRSLEYLHWNCLSPGTAVSHIADAIEDGRFPKLHTVKIPCDYEGAIQGLCRPIPRLKMTQDDLNYLDRHQNQRNLRVAQIQAQLRVRESRRRRSFQVLVQDDEMEVHDMGFIGSYLGSMGSKIRYSLEPDEGSEQALTRFEDFAAPRMVGDGRIARRVDAAALF